MHSDSVVKTHRQDSNEVVRICGAVPIIPHVAFVVYPAHHVFPGYQTL